jgi:hypothetical protein
LSDAYLFDGFYAWNHTRPYDDGREGLEERDGYFLDLGGAGDTTDEEQFWRGCDSGPRCHPALSRVPVYHEFQSGRYITYWFFYAYNDGFSLGNHEGDWEAIVVRLNNDNRATEVSYNRHNCNRVFDWEDIRKTNSRGRVRASGTHPLVYSARGSHASYAGPGRRIQVCGTPGDAPVYDYIGNGAM